MSSFTRQVAPEMARQDEQQQRQQQHQDHDVKEVKPSHDKASQSQSQSQSQHKEPATSTYHFTAPTIAKEADTATPLNTTMAALSTAANPPPSSSSSSSSSPSSSSAMSPYFHFNLHNEAPLWFEFLRPDSGTMLAVLCLLLALCGVFYRFLHRVDRSLQARWVRSGAGADADAYQGPLRSAPKTKVTRSLRFTRHRNGFGKHEKQQRSDSDGLLESGHSQSPLLDKRNEADEDEDKAVDDRRGNRHWKVDLTRGVWFMFITAVGYLLMLSVMTYNPYFFLALLLGLGLGETLFGRRGERDIDTKSSSPDAEAGYRSRSRASNLAAYADRHPHPHSRHDAAEAKHEHEHEHERRSDSAPGSGSDSGSDDGARPSDGGALRFAHFQHARVPNNAHMDARVDDVGTIASCDLNAGPTLRLVNDDCTSRGMQPVRTSPPGAVTGSNLVSPLHLPTPLLVGKGENLHAHALGRCTSPEPRINRVAVTAARKGFTLAAASSSSSSSSSGTGHTGLASSGTISSHSASIHTASRSTSSTQQSQQQALMVRNGPASTSSQSEGSSRTSLREAGTRTAGVPTGVSQRHMASGDYEYEYKGPAAWSYPPSLYSSGDEEGRG